MKIAKQISTGKWIQDFQLNATAEGLIENAVRMGIAKEDVEVVDVDEATFKSIVDAEYATIRAEKEAEATLSKQQMLQVGQAIKTKLGLTTAQMKKFVQFMRQVDEVDIV